MKKISELLISQKWSQKGLGSLPILILRTNLFNPLNQFPLASHQDTLLQCTFQTTLLNLWDVKIEALKID